MTQFEFLMTFASVVLAIALTEMLGGWGKLIRSGVRIRWSGLWVGWSLIVVSIIIMYWSGMWPYRDQSFSEGYKIFWLAIPTFFLVVMGYLLSPEPKEGVEEVDLKTRYWQISSKLFPLLALFMVSAQFADVIIIGEIRERGLARFVVILGQVVALSITVAAGFIKMPWLHWAALVIFSLGPIRYLFGSYAVFG